MGRRGTNVQPGRHCGSADCALQIEYLVVAFDEQHQKVRLSLCQAEVLKALARDEELAKKGPVVPDLQNGYVGFCRRKCCP